MVSESATTVGGRAPVTRPNPSFKPTPSARPNAGVMHKAILAACGVLVGGCASTPEAICDHGAVGLTVMSTPPAEAARLLSDIRSRTPKRIDEKRDHMFWLQSEAGDLFLCTYRRHPIRTGTCGATVDRFARTADGYEGVTVTISSCH